MNDRLVGPAFSSPCQPHGRGAGYYLREAGRRGRRLVCASAALALGGADLPAPPREPRGECRPGDPRQESHRLRRYRRASGRVTQRAGAAGQNVRARVAAMIAPSPSRSLAHDHPAGRRRARGPELPAEHVNKNLALLLCPADSFQNLDSTR